MEVKVLQYPGGHGKTYYLVPENVENFLDVCLFWSVGMEWRCDTTLQCNEGKMYLSLIKTCIALLLGCAGFCISFLGHRIEFFCRYITVNRRCGTWNSVFLGV